VFDEQENPEIIMNKWFLRCSWLQVCIKLRWKMWSMFRRNKGRCMLLEKGCKPLKASQKIPKPRCAGLEKKNRCLVIGKDHTSLLSTRMAKVFRNKIMATECVLSNISRGSVGNDQERICNCICL
jgi:hypothetical protein